MPPSFTLYGQPSEKIFCQPNSEFDHFCQEYEEREKLSISCDRKKVAENVGKEKSHKIRNKQLLLVHTLDFYTFIC